MKLSGIVGSLHRYRNSLIATGGRTPLNGLGLDRNFSGLISEEESELKEFNNYLDNLKNHEKSGVPKGAGTDSDDGFDLGRMKRLMQSLGNPQYKYKVRLYLIGNSLNFTNTNRFTICCYSLYRPFTLLGPKEKVQPLHLCPIFYVLKAILLVATRGITCSTSVLNDFIMISEVTCNLKIIYSEQSTYQDH